MGDLLQWWLLIYKVPTEPARTRTYIWRKLKKLGALYLQQAAALLPDRPEIVGELESLAERIRQSEGEVTLLQTRSASPEWEAEVTQRFNRQRDEEYAELVEVAQRLIDEIERESRRDKFSFAELEENEEGLESVRRWLALVKARDFFGAAGRADMEATLERAAARLQQFASQVYERNER